MSYVFSENYIRQKLRRLEEINEENRAKLAMYNRKKSVMSRKEYERYKKILFGTDYRSERESLQNSQNQENEIVFKSNQQNKQSDSKQVKGSSGTKSSKSKGKTKSMSQTAGNIITSASNKFKKQDQSNGIKQGNYTGGFQQRSTQNNQEQISVVTPEVIDQRYATPQQESLDEQGNSQLEADHHANLQSNYNMVTFNSAGQKMNTFNPSATNQDSILYQTQNYEEFDYEQQQLIKYIKKIEMEKQELENDLLDLQLKAANLHVHSNRKNKSVYDEVFKEQEEQAPIESKSLLHLKKVSPRQSPTKMRQTSLKGSADSFYKQPNYRQVYLFLNQKQFYFKCSKQMILNHSLFHDYIKKQQNKNILTTQQMQKNIGLDFESQWDMLEKWESVNQRYPITPTSQQNASSPAFHYEDPFLIQEQLKSTFWESIHQMKKEKSEQNSSKKPIHSYLPSDENWETKFNKIGKTYEERYTVVDNDINFGLEFVGRRPSNYSVGKYVVNRYTIDKLSDDIDMLMRSSKFNSSPFKSLKSSSPFKKKRSLFEIPEEYSQDNSVNY